MERAKLIYFSYTAVMLVFVASIILTPILAFKSDMSGIYRAFEYTCHQKLSRSLCVFSDGNGYWIADCLPQRGQLVTNPADRSAIKVVMDSVVGYKMPVCSRDFGIYGAMLLAAIAYPFTRKIGDKTLHPAIFLVLALVPIGLDGGVQLLSDIHILPFAYESTNLIRLLTGAIAGAAATFYAVPLLINILTPENR